MCLVGRLFTILMILTLGACGTTWDSPQLQPGRSPASNIKNQHSNVDQGDRIHDSQERYRHGRDSTPQQSDIDWRKTAKIAAGVIGIGLIITLAITESEVLEDFEDTMEFVDFVGSVISDEQEDEAPDEEEEETIFEPQRNLKCILGSDAKFSNRFTKSERDTLRGHC